MIAGGRRVVSYKPGEPWRLYTVSDVHIGSAGCAEDSFRRYVDRIAADPCGLWIGIGDYTDAIGYRDKRFNPLAMPDWMRVRDLASIGGVLFDYFLSIVKQVASKCLGVCWGNHEDSLLRDTQSWDRWVEFAAQLGVPDLGICGFRDLVFTPAGKRGGAEQRFRILAHHGAGAAQTGGGKINRLAKTMDDFPRADLVLIGHLHDQIDKRRTAIDADEKCERIIDTTRLGVMCGTWLRTYTQGHVGYGEVKGYSPTPMGNAVVEIDPQSRAMSVRWQS